MYTVFAIRLSNVCVCVGVCVLGAKRYTGQPVNRNTDGRGTCIVSRVCFPVHIDTPNRDHSDKHERTRTNETKRKAIRKGGPIIVSVSSLTV
jgi:hypothetical protein